MNIEFLPNELFINVFTYLSTADLLGAFNGLNSRFSILLSEHCGKYGLDFQGISRSNFDNICQRCLPQLADRIHSIRLNNDERTPGQVDQFYRHGLRLDQFTYLKSLSVYHLRSEELACKLMLEIEKLPNLIDLTYRPVYLPMIPPGAQYLMNCIWQLKKLQHCRLAFQSNNFQYFPMPVIKSISLECLTIEEIELMPNEIAQLINQTPNLRNVSFRFRFQMTFNFRLKVVSQITTLSIYCSGRWSLLIDILVMIPSLCKLKLHLESDCIDGRIWEEIIRQYLPNLKILEFLMSYKFLNDTKKEQQIDCLLDTFRSDFWLLEYRCFVRSDWNADEMSAHIYTLPYSFEGFSFSYPRLSKTTFVDQNKQWSYNSVHSLEYRPQVSQCSSLSNIQLYKIRNLSVRFPLDNHFWSIIQNFDSVTHLVVSFNDDIENCRIQLQILLSRMSHLSTLFIHGCPSFVLQLLKSQRIPRYGCFLNLLSSGLWYNNEQCVELTSLPFVNQWKAIALAVENRSCVVDLVKGMINLHALNVLCRDDPWKYGKSPKTDELVDWLRQQLSYSCTIRRCPSNLIIELWIS